MFRAPSKPFPFAYANYIAGTPYEKKDFSHWDPTNDRYLNSAAFASPDPFTFGNTARYLDWVRGPSSKSESLSFLKSVDISERVKFNLSADLINPFNIVRWGNPSTLVGVPDFGRITTTQGARQIQINVGLSF